MKTIQLKKFLDSGETYTEVIQMILTQPLLVSGQNGMQPEPISTAQILKFIPIVQKLKKLAVPTSGVSVPFLLEDAEYEVIKERVTKWNWGGASESIFDFITEINAATDPA
jgi:hypothetical protein